MKVISYSDGGHSYNRRIVAELSEHEADRIVPSGDMTKIKQTEVHLRLGTEIDLTPTFDKLDYNARKANQLESLMRSITACNMLVFFDPKP